MSLWRNAYEEAAATIKSSSRSPSPVKSASRSPKLLRQPCMSPGQDALAPGQTRFLGSDRRSVSSRSASPVAAPVPVQEVLGRSCLLRGTAAEHSRGGALSLQAVEHRPLGGDSGLQGEHRPSSGDAGRQGHLGLRPMAVGGGTTDRREEILKDSARIREVELSSAELRLQPDLAPVLDRLAVLRKEVQAHSGTLGVLEQHVQELCTAAAENQSALRVGFQASESATRQSSEAAESTIGELLRRLLGEFRAEVIGVNEVLTEQMRADVIAKTHEVGRDISAAVSRMGGELHQEVSDVRADLRWILQEMKDSKQAIGSLKSEVLTAINTSSSDVTDTIRAAKPDHRELLNAIHGIKVPSESDIVTSMRKVKTEPDLSSVIASLRASIDASQQKTLALIDSGNTRTTQAIQNINATSEPSSLPSNINIGRMIGDLETNIMDAMRSLKVQQNVEAVARSTDLCLGFEPILECIESAKAEIQATNAAVLQRLSSFAPEGYELDRSDELGLLTALVDAQEAAVEGVTVVPALFAQSIAVDTPVQAPSLSARGSEAVSSRRPAWSIGRLASTYSV